MFEAERNQITELWINEILSFITNLDIDKSLKNRVRECLESQKELVKNGMVALITFGTHTFKKRYIDILSDECTLFMNYLNSILNSKGEEYYKLAIEYSLSNNNMSFIDNLIRFIVITNYNDIEVIDNINVKSLMENINDFNSSQGSIRAYLGGFLLCDLSSFTLYKDSDGNKYLDFYNFHSRKNLTRTRVGTLLMRNLLDKMLNDSLLCDCSLVSHWVMKSNTLGKKFYKKIGFKFLGPSGEVVDYNYYDEFIKVKREDYPNLSEKEFYALRKRMHGNFCIIIPSQEKQMLLNKEFSYPYIEFNGKKIDCTTVFNNPKKQL